jgi:uncharacterized protein YkwD
MTFTLTSRRKLRGRLGSPGEQRLIPLKRSAGHHIGLSIKANGSYPLVSIETKSGDVLLDSRAYGPNHAVTTLLDPLISAAEPLVARVSMQPGHTGRFTLKLVDQGDLRGIRRQVLRQTNRVRRRRGLDPLTLNRRLNIAAQNHVDDMESVGRYLGHDSSDGRTMRDRIDASGYRWRSIRENAASQQISAKEVVQSWMDSPGHRANLLAKDVSEIGIGFGVDDASGDTYWIQKFADPL